RELEVELRLPEHVFAGTAFSGAILLRNRRRWVPAFSISVLAINKEKATQHWQWMPAKFSFPPGRPAGRQWLQIPDRRLRRVPKVLAPPVIFQGSAYFPYVPPKAELSAELELRFDRRGRYQQDKLGLATRFPFAFLRKTRRGMWTGKQPPNQVRSKYASSAVKMIANYESCSTIHPLESCQNRPMKMQSGWQHRWHGTSPGKTPRYLSPRRIMTG